MKWFYLLIITILTGILVGAWFLIAFLDNKGTGEVKDFSIANGETVSEIGINLTKQGLIKNPLVFRLAVYLKGGEQKIKAGRYQLSSSYSLRQIINLLLSGKGLSEEETITVIEGWTNAEIGQMLERKGMFPAEEWQEAVGFPATYYKGVEDYAIELDSAFKKQFDFLTGKPKNVGLEGYLYPDTYRIFKNASIEDVVSKMLDNFNDKLTSDLRAEIKNQGKTVFEVVTLASIVEKELATALDRRIAADLFWRRIKIGMPLQSDATINYITKKGLTRPSREDTEINNPYNTYKNYGLPPAPICNPSIEAIKAVIYPQPNDFLFFLTTSTGKVIYSKTYEEHQMNIDKYL